MSLLLVGTVAFDAIETPFGKVDRIVGGAATYAAYAASHYVRNIHLVSVVGDDFPMDVLADLNQRGVDLQGLEVRPGEKSFFWSGKYRADLNTRDTLATDLNVLATFNPRVPDSALRAEHVLLGNLDPEVQRSVLDQLDNRMRLVVMDTMNYWLDSQRPAVLNLLPRVDVLTINDEEARQLAGEYSLRKAAKAILSMGPRFLVIKKGEHGALLFHGDQVFHCAAMPLEDVFDPTGAGDSFAGAFLGHLAHTHDWSFDNMKRAVLHGSAMASFCVEDFGPNRLQRLQPGELQSRLEQFRQLVHVVL